MAPVRRRMESSLLHGPFRLHSTPHTNCEIRTTPLWRLTRRIFRPRRGQPMVQMALRLNLVRPCCCLPDWWFWVLLDSHFDQPRNVPWWDGLRSSVPPGQHQQLRNYSSSAEQIIASVVSISEAMEAAFCNAERVTFVGSITPALTKSSYSSVEAL